MSFCPDPLYNSSLTWNTTSPRLTRCMRDTLLVAVPLAVLIVIQVTLILVRRKSGISVLFPRPRCTFSAIFCAKLTLTVALVGNAIGEWVRRGPKTEYPSDTFAPACLLASYTLALVLLAWDKATHRHTSGPLFFFWLTQFVCLLPTFVARVEDLSSDNNKGWEEALLVATSWPLVAIQLLLNCFSDLDRTPQPSDPPECNASIISLMFFSWLDALVWSGFRAPLTQERLPRVPDTIDVGTNVSELQKRWRYHRGEWHSLWPALICTYWRSMIPAIVLAIVHYSLTFVHPLILKLLINHMDGDEEAWKGFFYTAVLFASSMTWTVTFHAYCQVVSVLSIQIRSAVISLIYRKSLRLSNSARKQFTVGEVTNFMSIDAQRIVDTFPYVNQIWTAPFTIGLAICFLYQEVGVGAFAALGVLVLLLPVNLWSSRMTQRLQDEQLVNKDLRIKLLNEVLAGIKALKLYAWELPFMKRVSSIRDKEVKLLKVNAKLWALLNLTFTCSSFMTLACFAVYQAIDPSTNILTADRIFVSVSLFNIMRLPLIMFPWAIMETVKLFVSLRRINGFLNAEEIDTDAICKEMSHPENAIEFEDASFSWEKEKKPILTSINLEIPRGSLIAVVGVVGSGKSSLVSAVLGEMDRAGGRLSRRGHTAYVPQQAWIQNMTLRDNVLFDKEWAPVKYQQVLSACALESDLATLTSGDLTEIGENGINLSGGQKQRVSLARAVYSDADVYLLDDPLSAVDAHVGKHIFDQVISNETGLLRDRTRVLVTHNVSFLDKIDKIVVMKDGRIAEMGTYQELKEGKDAFAEFIATYANEKDVEEEVKVNYLRSLSAPISNSKPLKALQRSQSSDGYSMEDEESKLFADRDKLKTLVIDKDDPRQENNSSSDMSNNNNDVAGMLIQEEEAMVGKVSWSVYITYAECMGYVVAVICILLDVLGHGVHAAGNYWLSMWADKNEADLKHADENTALYLSVYAATGTLEAVVDFCRELWLFLGCARASKVLHERLLRRVFHSPMSFFDTNPIGRIINRFSGDIETVDQTIPSELSDFFWCMCDVLAMLVVVISSTPMFASIIGPLFLVYFSIQKFYIATSRQLKRLQSISKSPIFAHFSESVQGAVSIRAYVNEDRFVAESEGRVATNVRSYYLSLSSNRWLGTRMETLGNCIILFAALFSVLARNKLTAGVAGLSITYALQVTDTLNWMIRMACELETNSVAVERILEYSRTVQEAEWTSPETDSKVSSSWPEKGEVTFEDYQTRYRPGLDLVLKGINMDIQGNEKIGLCGRTGAGKSSLTLALFRIIEAAGGRILIDGVDIASLGLHQLRSRLTIIPQDPVLFTGSLRFNLDPTGENNDDAMWKVLEHAYLRDYVTSLPGGLDHEVSEGGHNFSFGQRQLICLARALLRKTKILVLDEATAAVDLETDDIIQATIRREFSDCTILTIAHRLNTIMDSDRIAVFKKGKLEEIDPPDVLIQDPSSAFAEMARNAGLL